MTLYASDLEYVIARRLRRGQRDNPVLMIEQSKASRDCVPPIPQPSVSNQSPYFPTITLMLAFLPLAVLTVMVAEPLFFAVTMPYWSTVATFLLEDFQV